MENSHTAKEEQSYEDFVPFCNWQKHEEYDILEIHLPGFRRQEIRLQFNDLGILTISGKQGSDGDESSTTTSMRSRFHKEMKISRNCRADQIRAKFSRGILSITVPKKAVKLSKQSAENSEQSAHNLFGFGGTVLRPKLSKENALKMVLVSLAMVLAGYAVYRLCII
ncbi:putative HSP20-like chaperone [Rosa chinensis]|uniref:Putative HSP20-like chaperone n=1 Tax=Rosa chinensis TaxID=74649 RepID=A0A2P6RHH9_ROSCH|nr:18.1 kDa class I heat shock protein [Rosa chinensis]PRQ45889.1 putative HSP20-like chaperone [Rosa chinensis]